MGLINLFPLPTLGEESLANSTLRLNIKSWPEMKVKKGRLWFMNWTYDLHGYSHGFSNHEHDYIIRSIGEIFTVLKSYKIRRESNLSVSLVREDFAFDPHTFQF